MLLIFYCLDLSLIILTFLDFTVHCAIPNPSHDTQSTIGIQTPAQLFGFVFNASLTLNAEPDVGLDPMTLGS